MPKKTDRKTTKKRRRKPSDESEEVVALHRCGQCKWYVLPKRTGQTCRTLLGVSVETASCKDFEQRPVGVKTPDELKRDPFVEKLRQKLLHKKYKVDPRLLREVKGYLVFRKEMKDRVERPVPERVATRKELLELGQFFEECQAYRDRVAEIRMTLAPIKRKLKTLRFYAESWCYEQPYINEVLRTVDQRKAVVVTILKPLTERMTLVESVERVCELAESNLSSAHFSLKEMKEVTQTFLGKQIQT
jgi:hypothetical protein